MIRKASALADHIDASGLGVRQETMPNQPVAKSDPNGFLEGDPVLLGKSLDCFGDIVGQGHDGLQLWKTD